MRKPMITRTELARVADSFRDELARLHSQMDWPDYKSSTLVLSVNYSHEKVAWEVKCNAGSSYGAEVKGSDLGVVMDEVYRRLGYEHREEARIETSMAALPAPERPHSDIAKRDEIGLDCGVQFGARVVWLHI
jgi:hypothetical protein